MPPPGDLRREASPPYEEKLLAVRLARSRGADRWHSGARTENDGGGRGAAAWSVRLLLAWILWQQTSPAGQVPPRAVPPPTVWNAVQTFATQPECEAGKRSRLDRWRAADEEGYEVSGDTVTIALEGMEASMGYVCLPETTDPSR